MRTISVLQLKGGVGKTMTTLSLAYVIADKFKKKCLVIDLDSQSSASILTGVTPNNYDKRTPFSDIPEALKKLENEDLSYEIDELDKPDADDESDYQEELDVNGIQTIFEDMMDQGFETNGIPEISKEIVDSCIHTPTYSLITNKLDENGKTVRDKNGYVIREKKNYYFGFDIIPSTEYLADIEFLWDEKHLGKLNYMNRGKQLKMVIDFIEKNYDYDYCLIDCPPGLSLLVSNSVYASTGGILIPVSQDKQSLYSLRRLKRNIKTIKNASPGHLGILGIVLTIYNKRRTVDQYIAMY